MVWLWSVTLILWIFLFFSFSLCFVHFFLYENDYLSCDMLQRKHIQVSGPQTSHSVPSVPLFFFFFLFFFLFPFFSFFLFFSSFSLFFVQLEKKKDHFFSSLAVLVLDQSQDGLENSGRHAEDSWEHLLFAFIFQKVFAFVLQCFFSLTVLKVKEWPPFPPDPTRLQPDSKSFSPPMLLFFLGLLASGFLDLLSFRLWKQKVLSILGGMWYCLFFILWLSVRFLFCIFLGALWHHTANPTGGFWRVSQGIRLEVLKQCLVNSSLLAQAVLFNFLENLLIQLLFVFQQML